MIIVNALLLVLTSTGLGDAYSSYQELTKKITTQVEWIDSYGSKVRHRSEAQETLNRLVASVKEPVFTLRHQSEWKNDQSFRIIHVDGEAIGYRIFFQCKRTASGNCVVTKIKISKR